MRVAIFIENERIELFNDENIEIVSSITDSSDVSSNTTDYSKGFTVPASDKNNAIFKHYYNANIDNTFDARVKKNARIEIDGLPFKSGKMRLDKVNIKNDKPSSYSLNFFGKLLNLKDKLKDDELTSLDLSDLNFDWTYANMIEALKNDLSDGKIIANLITKKRVYYNSDPSDNTNDETIFNIRNVGANPLNLRPSIKLIEIIKAIESKYDFNFSNDFFGRTEFDQLYLWLNNSATLEGRPSEQLLNLTNSIGFDLGFNITTKTWINSSYFNSTTDFRRFRYRVAVLTPSTNPYTIVVKNFGQVVAEIEGQSGFLQSEWIEILTQANTPFSIQFFIRSVASITYEASIQLEQTTYQIIAPISIQQAVNTPPLQDLITQFQVANNMPKMKIIDFLKSLFQLFKLVIIQENDTDIYVNTLVDYYTQGKLWDVTKYVNFDSNEVNRGDLLNEINFNFVEPSTFLNKQFKLNTGIAYGDEELKLSDENGELLDGKKLEIKPQFEQILYERLTDLNDSELTNIMYGLTMDENLKPKNPKAHIFYNNRVDVTAKPFKVQTNASGANTTITGLINTSAHTLGFVEPQFATIFSEEFNAWNGALISNNLYTNYYKNYIESIFNIKRRDFTFKSILPLHILLALRLNDVLKIKENYYRIDKYTANITSKEVQLNLINAFDTTINSFTTTQTIYFIGAKQASQTVYVNSTSEFTGSLKDDPTWLDFTIDGNLVTLTFDENTTGELREAELSLDRGKDNIKIQFVQEI
jgi:hypothetical protein